MLDLEDLKRLAEVEFADIVNNATIIECKLRITLITALLMLISQEDFLINLAFTGNVKMKGETEVGRQNKELGS